MSIVTEKTINQLDESSRDDEKDINEREVLKETKRLEGVMQKSERWGRASTCQQALRATL